MQMKLGAGIGRGLGRSIWIAAGLAVILLGGCREEEQGRILKYDKGTYLGKKDSGLKPETIDSLRQRALNQRM